MKSNLQRILGSWGAWVARHPWVTIFVFSILGAALVPCTFSTLKNLDSDISNQVSDKLERFQSLRELSEDFGGDLLVAVVSMSPEAAKDENYVRDLKSFSERLVTELEKVGMPESNPASAPASEAWPPGPWLKDIECRIGQAMTDELERVFKDYPYAVFDLKCIEELSSRFSASALEGRLKEIRALLSDPALSETGRQRIYSDPLDLAEIVKSSVRSKKKGIFRAATDTGSGAYYLSEDRTTLLVLARPVRDARNLDFNRALIAGCERAKERAAQHLLSMGSELMIEADETEGAIPEPQGLNVQCGFMGLHVIAVENEASLRYDILWNMATAALLVALIYLICYRSVRVAFCVVVALGLAVHLTLGALWFLNGHLGVIGAGFTAILIGMGEDYAVYLHNSFQDLRKSKSLGTEQALGEALASCGPNVLTAALTTAISFFSICITEFRGLAELGMLAGIGLSISAFLMLSLFPALMVVLESHAVAEPVSWLRRMSAWFARKQGEPAVRPWFLASSVLVGLVLIAIVLLTPASSAERVLGVPFDGEFANLRSVRIRALALRDRVAKRFGHGLTEVRVEVSAGNETSAYAGLRAVRKKWADLESQGALVYGGSIIDFLRDPIEQASNIQSLQKLNLKSCSDQFVDAAVREFGERGRCAFSDFVERTQSLATRMDQAVPLLLKTCTDGSLRSAISPFARTDGSEDDSRIRLLAYYYPQQALNDEAWFERLAKTVESNSPGDWKVRMTSARMAGFELKHHFLRDMSWITALVSVVVLCVVWWKFRSLYVVGLSLLPLLFGYLSVMAGVTLMHALGYELSLNYVNLIVFPLLLGTGIDYGIYMVSDVRGAPDAEKTQVLSKTGLTVFLACLTTLAGFGSMIFSSHTGLISFGWAALLGYTGTLFGALVVLPMCLKGVRNH